MKHATNNKWNKRDPVKSTDKIRGLWSFNYLNPLHNSGFSELVKQTDNTEYTFMHNWFTGTVEPCHLMQVIV